MDSKKIGELIKNKRKEKGLTQEELANTLYVSNKTISKWETGRGVPSIDLLKPISKTLNIELNELLGESKDTPYEEIILKELKKAKEKQKIKIIIGILTCLILCILETIIYIAKVREPLGTIIFILFFIMLIIIDIYDYLIYKK